MHKMTEADLWAAFAGESQAHVKYLAFAAKAKDEGFPKLARLFEAISFAELVHAHNHLRALAGLGNSIDNLKAAVEGENYEVDEMYPAFNSVAGMQNESAAARTIHYAQGGGENSCRVLYPGPPEFGDRHRCAMAEGLCVPDLWVHFGG